MKRLVVCAGLLLSQAAQADSPIMVWGAGRDLCPALVKAADQNLERYQADHKGGKPEDVNFADAALPYMQYISGVAQGYEQGSHQAMTSSLNSLFFGAVEYCRQHPADKVATAVADSLAQAKFGK